MGAVLLLTISQAMAQGESPVPGSWSPAQSVTESSSSAPVPGAGNSASHRFTNGVAAAISKYAQLPLSIFDAKSRMQELRTMAAVAKPEEVLESVNRLSEWLGDMLDAHNRMAAVFAKHEQTKLQALAEKQAGQKFSQVRNQAQLLKAELLIQQHRYPEALTPLVDIVIAEPTSATGLAAYGKLKELGFSEEPPLVPETAALPNAVNAEPFKHLVLPVKKPATIPAASVKRIH